MNTAPSMNPAQKRKVLLDSLIPGLKDILLSLNIGDKIIKYIAELPPGSKVYLKNRIDCFPFSFPNIGYLPDILAQAELPFLGTQEEILLVLNFFKGDKKLKQHRKKFFLTISTDGKNVLWLDLRTQNHSFYLGRKDIWTTFDMFFLMFEFLVNGIHKN